MATKRSKKSKSTEPRVYGFHQKLSRAEVREVLMANLEEGKTRLYPNLEKYQVTVQDGVKKMDIGDEVAIALRDCVEPNDVFKTASKVLGREVVSTLKEKYQNLNFGMVRMNLGNRMRAVIRSKPELAAKLG